MACIGVVHPGAMGTSLGAALRAGGHDVVWAGEGRSAATRARAEADGLRDVETLHALADAASVVISVCPPSAAAATAGDVTDLGFTGIYLDANAIAPETARAMAREVSAAGATYVDGGIVGPPARHRGLTVLYLSGPDEATHTLDSFFADSVLMTHRVAGDAGAASATKMAFAAWTKGTSALLLAIRALAEHEGVEDALDHAWSVLTPELSERLPHTVSGIAPKAWRFEGEMREIAATFAAAGLPDGFHTAAAEIYARLADLRELDSPGIRDVVDRL